MALLKQSTARNRMFLLVLSSDHLSPATGKSPAVTISKDGGAFAAPGGAVTEVSGGWYKVALTTTDTNTLGDLAFHVTEASSDATDFADQVVAALPGEKVAVTLAAADVSGNLPADAKAVNAVSTAAVSAVNAIVGTAQPTNFTGTGASALVKSDVVDIAGAAVSAAAAQLGVNVVNFGGAAGVFSGGRPEVNTTRWNGSAPNALVAGRVDALAGDVGLSALQEFLSVNTGYLVGDVSAGSIVQLVAEAVWQGGLAPVRQVTGGAIDTVSGDLAGNVLGKVLGGGAGVIAGTGVQAQLPTNGITAASVSAAAADKIADHGRRRTQAHVEASADGDALDRKSLYGFIQEAQNASLSGTTLTVKKTDGTTLGSFTVTTDAAALPVTGVS